MLRSGMRPTLITLLVAASLAVACSEDEGTATNAPGSGGGAGTGGTGVASGGTGGAPLPCDECFTFLPDPPGTGSVLSVAYTHASPLTYVALVVVGPGNPNVLGAGISTSNPWTWDYDVTGLTPAVYSFEFWAGQPSARVASCQRLVHDTGAAPDAGAGGSSGAGGGGGSGGHCCHLVGTQLSNPSPCGPSAAASPWQTLDNAGCDGDKCKKIWCPFEKCDSSKYPSGCPQGTESCWIDDSFTSYEGACKSCCEAYGACWDSALGTCRHPGDCGKPIWKCPWEP